MIGFLKGRVLAVHETQLTVGVGDSDKSLVGYEVSVSGLSLASIAQGQSIELYIYTHVREDAFVLYGFLTLLEKRLFMTLLQVSGIGPKGAMGLLSSGPATQLIDHIVAGDVATLTRAPGVGKKTAERLVLELSDTLIKKLGVEIPRAVTRLDSTKNENRILDSKLEESRAALVGLGYRDNEVQTLLKKLALEGTAEASVQDLIKRALRELAL